MPVTLFTKLLLAAGVSSATVIGFIAAQAGKTEAETRKDFLELVRGLPEGQRARVLAEYAKVTKEPLDIRLGKLVEVIPFIILITIIIALMRR